MSNFVSFVTGEVIGEGSPATADLTRWVVDCWADGDDDGDTECPTGHWIVVYLEAEDRELFELSDVAEAVLVHTNSDGFAEGYTTTRDTADVVMEDVAIAYGRWIDDDYEGVGEDA